MGTPPPPGLPFMPREGGGRARGRVLLMAPVAVVALLPPTDPPPPPPPPPTTLLLSPTKLPPTSLDDDEEEDFALPTAAATPSSGGTGDTPSSPVPSNPSGTGDTPSSSRPSVTGGEPPLLVDTATAKLFTATKEAAGLDAVTGDRPPPPPATGDPPVPPPIFEANFAGSILPLAGSSPCRNAASSPRARFAASLRRVSCDQASPVRDRACTGMSTGFGVRKMRRSRAARPLATSLLPPPPPPPPPPPLLLLLLPPSSPPFALNRGRCGLNSCGNGTGGGLAAREAVAPREGLAAREAVAPREGLLAREAVARAPPVAVARRLPITSSATSGRISATSMQSWGGARLQEARSSAK